MGLFDVFDLFKLISRLNYGIILDFFFVKYRNVSYR